VHEEVLSRGSSLGLQNLPQEGLQSRCMTARTHYDSTEGDLQPGCLFG